MQESEPLSSSEMSQLLHRHAPVIRLSEWERNMPCSMEYFLHHSEYWRRHSDGTWRIVLPPGGTGFAVLACVCTHAESVKNQYTTLRINHQLR